MTPTPTATRPASSPERRGPRHDLKDELFDEWVGARRVQHLGSNAGAEPLPFQSWHRFKEAFPPELIKQLIEGAPGEIESCIDPFGGSGTTALAAQFLGVSSTTIEINPFLVDVIRSKVQAYEAEKLGTDLSRVRRSAQMYEPPSDPAELFTDVPPTFIEPGLDDRWIFDREVAEQLAALLAAIAPLPDATHRRFFRTLIGGLLADVSNVIVSGKGRRYRRNWQDRRFAADAVVDLFCERAKDAIGDVYEFADRPKVRAHVLHGDARAMATRRKHDIAIFSPPYPNSFDYTDVYNLELWMLGYLTNSQDNRELRLSTVTSHVQLLRDYTEAPSGSKTLEQILSDLTDIEDELWSRWIPSMVGAYFADLMQVIDRLRTRLRPGAQCCIVVGDSRYGGVLVPTARILGELAATHEWELERSEPVRAMRSSAQQGLTDLSETLLVLSR